MNSRIDQLYDSIASDLKITRFRQETDIAFHNRLIYSAMGKWVLQLFNDRDFESDGDIIGFDEEQVSKTHVLFATLEVLDMFKTLDSLLQTYFSDSSKFIKLVERTYVSLGYICSGHYLL